MATDVLMVDDAHELSESTAEYLSAFGLTTHCEGSAEDALVWLATNETRLIDRGRHDRDQVLDRRPRRIVYGGSAALGTFTDIAAAAPDASGVPDGIFLGRGGLDPQNFLATLAEVRSVNVG